MQTRRIKLITRGQPSQLASIIRKRDAADDQWVAAQAYLPDHDMHLGEKDLDVAYAAYVECESALQSYVNFHGGLAALLQKDQLARSVEFSGQAEKGYSVCEQLYFTFKTLADAHFEQSNYLEARECYLQAASLLKYGLNDQGIKERMNVLYDSRAANIYANLRYNAALSAIYYYEHKEDQASDPLSDDDKRKVTSVLARAYLQLKQEKLSSAYVIRKHIDNLLRGRILFHLPPIVLSSARETDHFYWCIESIFTEAQLKVLVSSPFLNMTTCEQFTASPLLNLTEKQRDAVRILFHQDTFKMNNKESQLGVVLAQKMTAFKMNDLFTHLSLKNHQMVGFDSIQKHFANGHTVAGVTMATGTGKTRLFISVILANYYGSQVGLQRMRHHKALIVVPQLSLSEQTAQRIQEFIQPRYQLSVAEFNGTQKNEGDVTIICLSSLIAEMKKQPRARLINLDQYGLVVFDEIHEALTEKCKELIFELKLSKLILTMTATDHYNTNRHRGSLRSVSELLGQENCIYHYSLMHAIADRVLSPLRVCLVEGLQQLPARCHKEKNSSVKKDFNTSQIYEAWAEDNFHEVNATATEVLLNLTHPDTGHCLSSKKIFIFCLNISHAKALTAMLVAQKMKAATISGHLNVSEQQDVIAQFRRGDINVLCSVDILNTGIDVAELEVLFNIRPTRSSVLALQRLGRVTRLADNKVCGLVIEMVVSKDQLLASSFLGNKQSAGILPALSDNKLVVKQSCVAKEKRIAGASAWSVCWDKSINSKPALTVVKQISPIAVPTVTTAQTRSTAQPSMPVKQSAVSVLPVGVDPQRFRANQMTMSHSRAASFSSGSPCGADSVIGAPYLVAPQESPLLPVPLKPISVLPVTPLSVYSPMTAMYRPLQTIIPPVSYLPSAFPAPYSQILLFGTSPQTTSLGVKKAQLENNPTLPSQSTDISTVGFFGASRLSTSGKRMRDPQDEIEVTKESSAKRQHVDVVPIRQTAVDQSSLFSEDINIFFCNNTHDDPWSFDFM